MAPQCNPSFKSGDLKEREGQNGQHTLTKHSSQTDEQIRARFQEMANNPRNANRDFAVSTYSDEATTQRVVNESIAQNRGVIKEWLSSGSKKYLELEYKSSQVIGRGINSGEISIGTRTDAKTILKPNGKGKFDIITSYPIK